MKYYTIYLEKEKKAISASEGASLLSVLSGAGVMAEAPCGGHGTCGKCRMLINGEMKKACQTVVENDMTVLLPEMAEHEVLTGGIDTDTDVKPYKEGYLLAVDIGTTTIVCYLLDGQTGKELANASMLNPQISFGADVISRIQAAVNGQMTELTTCIRKGLAGLIAEVCKKAEVSCTSVSVLSVVGNPAMQQIFMGYLPENLVKVPFAPILTSAGTVSVSEYLPVCKDAEMLVVPDISGYVGADTMGCILSTGIYESKQITLMVDIGTNGEMILGNAEKMFACSTAAGPALEGAKIRFGMRGATGAIDHVWLENGTLRCSVIGGGKARGICGSGLIDMIAVCLETGLINNRGRIQHTDEIEGQRVVFLTEDIYLTQDDIREVQLAKGAIAAGIELLAEQMSICLEDINRVLLAGAFGNYMNPDSACRIGLLPSVLRGKIMAVGNAAGIGARMMACNRDMLMYTQQLLGKIHFIELADLPGFQRTFARNMRYPEG